MNNRGLSAIISPTPRRYLMEMRMLRGMLVCFILVASLGSSANDQQAKGLRQMIKSWAELQVAKPEQLLQDQEFSALLAAPETHREQLLNNRGQTTIIFCYPIASHTFGTSQNNRNNKGQTTFFLPASSIRSGSFNVDARAT